MQVLVRKKRSSFGSSWLSMATNKNTRKKKEIHQGSTLKPSRHSWNNPGESNIVKQDKNPAKLEAFFGFFLRCEMGRIRSKPKRRRQRRRRSVEQIASVLRRAFSLSVSHYSFPFSISGRCFFFVFFPCGSSLSGRVPALIDFHQRGLVC